MELNAFLDKLFTAAKQAGLEAAEAYMVEDESFRAMANNQEIVQYSSNLTKGLSFRVKVNGKIGYASTEAFDEDAVDWLIQRAQDSAVLCEDTSEQFIYDGKEPSPALNLEAAVGEPDEKLQFVLDLEKTAKAYDPRVQKVGYNTITTGRESVRIVNTFGMDKQSTATYGVAFIMPVATEGESTASGFAVQVGRGFAALDAKTLGTEAAEDAVSMLHAAAVPSGQYRVIIHYRAMTDLLETFASAFSAENVQKDLSVYKGKLGEAVAAPCVTIVDDSLRADGLASRPFDAEGVPGGTHAVIENGVLKTFLHNLKTAHKDGVKSTGNASKAGYSAPIRISPTNFYIEAGDTSFEQMLQNVGDGILIKEVEGLHAGADAVSGDFSLLSKGFTIKDGKLDKPVEQITIAGNFYEMLKAIQTVGSDLTFPQGAFGSPCVDVGKLSVAGK
ncbi:MAG TPA: TldD/PmbA family protein [Candidatus Limiplasma sp.]|nr:TldD/PmbA family protein [Candidatus Limiplasma sp.]